MKLTLLCAFGAGYVLGSRAGRDRYEQIRELARDAGQRLEESGVRELLEDYGGRLETYAARPQRSRSAT
ncbi:MAG TPA: hypothetical protein VGM79_04690 [Streptosporangiaceae bacterium]|jgi:hypothetical protein